MAYQASPKTVIRASGGIYFAPGFRSRLIAYGFTNSNSTSSPTGYGPIYNWTSGGYPSNFPRAPFIDPSFQNGQSVSSILPDTSRMPQILTWTFSIQREVARNLAFEATYVGSHSTHLILGGSLSNRNTLDPSISRWVTCCSRIFRLPLPQPPVTERRFRRLRPSPRVPWANRCGPTRSILT